MSVYTPPVRRVLYDWSNGKRYAGRSAAGIVESMMHPNFTLSDPEEWLNKMAERISANKIKRTDFIVTGFNLERRCESFLRQYVKWGLGDLFLEGTRQELECRLLRLRTDLVAKGIPLSKTSKNPEVRKLKQLLKTAT